MILKKFVRWLFGISGWTVVGSIPSDIPKAILVGGGHTSNWDLFGTLGTLTTLDKKFHFLIKEEAVRFPFKNLLLKLGAIPVKRTAPKGSNMVQQVADFLKARESGYVCISPEGTRKAVKKWKTGFYHIARKAQVPIILCYLDYKNKQAVVGEILQPTEPETEILRYMKEYFKKAVPKYPNAFQID